MNNPLDTPIQKLAYVGPRHLAGLKRLGITTVGDLLWHFPNRYEDFSQLIPISEIKNKGDVVSIRGAVQSVNVVSAWRRNMTITTAMIEDDSGVMRAVWFNQPYLERTFTEGLMLSLSGKISQDKKGIYLSNPNYEKSNDFFDLRHTGRLVPVYPETAGITSKFIRFLIKPILDKITDLEESLPEEIVKKYRFPSLNQAIHDIHFPKDETDTAPARQRFAFEEILLFQLRMLIDRKKLKSLPAPKIVFDPEKMSNFVSKLPFKLTDDQRKSAFEILKDLDQTFPMNRLLNGDVGSGKTVVAFMASYQASIAGYQSAMMVPTEILAQQHFESICSLCMGDVLRVGLLTGSGAKQFPTDEVTEEKITKKLMKDKIENGEIDLLIGTHAVIQKDVLFHKLGLVVIDEQHRFGIKQRMALVKNAKERNAVPHLLSMTATPIPRTLALTVYGDLDVSLIKEKPKGRQEIDTKVILESKRAEAYAFIDKQIAEGRQVFVICPRIAPSSDTAVAKKNLLTAEMKMVTEEFEKLSKNIFPHRRVAMLHGKLKAQEKDGIMRDFKDHKYDIIVSTSVIEVGVDVPNASIMMIESAERFGLAQLHQFRGRVGRGAHKSYCLLFTSNSDIPSTRRLRAMEDTNDGFKLAEMDLKIRGPGEFVGIMQSGLPDLAMASLSDVTLIKEARDEAKKLLEEDPDLTKHQTLKTSLEEMQKMVHFE